MVARTTMASEEGTDTAISPEEWSDAAISALIVLRDATRLHVSPDNDGSLAEKELLRNWHKLESLRDPTSCFGVKTHNGTVTELNFTDTNVVKLQVDDEAAWTEAFAGLPALQKLTLDPLGWDDKRDSMLLRCFPSSLSSCQRLTHLSCRFHLNGPFPWRELSELTLLEELDFTFCPFEESSISPQVRPHRPHRPHRPRASVVVRGAAPQRTTPHRGAPGKQRRGTSPIIARVDATRCVCTFLFGSRWCSVGHLSRHVGVLLG